MTPTAVLLSAGLDSAVLAAAEARVGEVHPIYISTGLAWERGELAALDRLLATDLIGAGTDDFIVGAGADPLQGSDPALVAYHPIQVRHAEFIDHGAGRSFDLGLIGIAAGDDPLGQSVGGEQDPRPGRALGLFVPGLGDGVANQPGHGVLATRSQLRPNSLGVAVVPLVKRLYLACWNAMAMS